MRFFLTAVLFFSVLTSLVSAEPAGSSSRLHATGIANSEAVVLGAKDFTADLPERLQDKATRPKVATLQITEKANFDLLVLYDQFVDDPNFFRRVEVLLPEPVESVHVGVVFGFPANLGTADKPLMAVPVVVQWTGEGWLRGGQWTLYADGRLEKL